ncbi:MAG TPA: Na-translocating system protein MpsC family protein [Solirubrobacterales bacterium]|nr:Na-translocating system protein MpsC family protein [Solirubrobacterales bacterium]
MNVQDTSPAAAGASEDHSVRAELSREMVRLYKDLFGRGPTRARTDFAGPDTILCTLEDSFTSAERALAELGEHHRLRDTRMYFQHATEDQFRETVERISGRKVRAFVSGMDTAEDVASEVFYLEPRS